MNKSKLKTSKLIFFLIILLVALLSGVITYAGMTTSDTKVPVVAVRANGQEIPADGYLWRVHRLGGIFYQDVKKEGNGKPYDLGDIQRSHVDIVTPEQFDTNISVTNRDDTVVFEGSPKAYEHFRLPQNGTYTFQIKARVPKKEKENYGEFYFSFVTNLTLEPQMVTSDTNIVQGDVLAIQITDVPEGVVPVVTSELGLSVFIEKDGIFKALVPVGYLKGVGTYPVTVTLGDTIKTIDVKVTEGNFQKQYLTINTSNPVISEASSPKAYEQYRQTIYPFFETADPETYWSGKFTQPVQGRISTEFGLLRYTNGSQTPSGHSGIDIAAAKGTPIIAPAAGRVVYADYLLNTGNTLVIEHGGGLKSYFYHINSLSVKAGDMVQQGQNVGEVGSTGYSTGAHLHYEVRMGNQALNPWNLFNGTGGFFALN